MRYLRYLSGRDTFGSFLILVAIASTPSLTFAASVTLSWQDNSTNEAGFKIERGGSGGYAEIATVGPNIRTYTNSGLLAGSTYCYRVRAFSSTGVSSPSNESCITIPTTTTAALNLTKSGTGVGSVNSTPAGINCGSDCLEAYTSGTIVSLTATAATGSMFAGWSGDSDCLDGVVTMNANKTCAATFNATTATSYTLTVNVTSGLSSGGSGSGSVTSSPSGITCGSDCSEKYSSGTMVSLAAIPAAGSKFAGWSGDSDCLDGIVTMGANKSCIATFSLDTVTLNLVRSGNGTVTSNPSGINCGGECSKPYAKGTKVTLSAKAGSDSKFSGWVGGGCQGTTDCTVSLTDSTSVSATFVGPGRSALGIFRPAKGEWFLDINENGIWDGCNIDACVGPFGTDGDLPVAGDWTGTRFSNIGVFRPSTGEWLLDLNGNGKWDGCNVDRCLRSSRPQDTLPIVGDWTGSGIDRIGEMISGNAPKWYLDIDGNGIIDSCKTDACLKFPSRSGDFPVTGDWNGGGKSNIGTFKPATGEWFLDVSGNGQWNNCKDDKCLVFGGLGDRPIVGNWTGSGPTKIGLYRPTTGQWFLDLNGNGKWDGCGTDGCSQFLGKHDGDLPIVGVW